MDRSEDRETGSRRREIEYNPLPSQRRFHESRARFKGFSGPIGSGKSQALCQEAIRMSYLNPGRTGIDWSADISDATGCDRGGAIRGIGAERHPARGESGRELPASA